jgi:hypothetical protein
VVKYTIKLIVYFFISQQKSNIKILIPEHFNNLNSNLDSVYKNEMTFQLTQYLSVFLLNFISYFYIVLKFYKVLCYSKMTFEWLPMINPYIWPFSVFHIITGPYFSFWSRMLPSIKLDKSSVEISGIIALEALNSLIYFCVKLTNLLIAILESTENVDSTSIIDPSE